MANKNKELREQLEAIKKKKKALKEKLKHRELELTHAKVREEKLNKKLASKNRDFNKMLVDSHKLINLIIQNKSPQCKFGLEGYNNNSEFSKPHYFVKTSIPLG